METLDNLLQDNSAFPKKDRAYINKVHEFAKNAHAGQTRYSGEPYINHAVRAAETLISLGADTQTIAAAILHDSIEDCDVSLETIQDKFGKEVASLVVGVSKLGVIKYQGHAQYADNMRHLFFAVATDVRVILIKLSDRLDNIRTLEYVPKHKQRRIALETLEIYAPIAHRLGMGLLKAELEDRAFFFAYPEEYKRVEKLLIERGDERKRHIEKIYKSLAKGLVKRNVHDVSVSYRIKNMYSIERKLLQKNMDVAKVYDIYALRVIAKSADDCYRLLGIIHNMWKPLPGRFKDYIANPKINGYQSLHTTVFIGDGGIAEIQIRTQEMHEEAEYGIASHLLYKESGVTKKNKMRAAQLEWLSKVKELHHEGQDTPDEFLNNLKLDFFEERVFAFTPRGDVISLPKGGTALDFAYAIHSEIGNHTSGVRVNGKLVALGTPLKNQDIVEIATKDGNHPTRKWLDYVMTSIARKYIKNYLKEH
jgi:GTP diphosphokinase / guanosine-3',5'-bis(diphosphate) 3'-diphosphatase